MKRERNRNWIERGHADGSPGQSFTWARKSFQPNGNLKDTKEMDQKENARQFRNNIIAQVILLKMKAQGTLSKKKSTKNDFYGFWPYL